MLAKIGGRGKPYHFTAAAFVVHEGKVLLVRHKKLNLWLPPGGHMEVDGQGFYIESPEEAAAREVLEETGLQVEIIGPRRTDGCKDKLFLALPAAVHLHPFDQAHDHFAFDYFARLVPGQSLRVNGDTPHRWFSREELEQAEVGSFDGTRLPSDVRESGLQAIAALDGKR